MLPSLYLYRSHYTRRKGISILLMAMFIIAVFYNGRQVIAAPAAISTKPHPSLHQVFFSSLRIRWQPNWGAVCYLSPQVGSHSPTGLPVAPAGPAGSGGHEGAEGTQRVSVAQHSAHACGSTFPGPQQERWGAVNLPLSCFHAAVRHFEIISRPRSLRSLL